MKPIRFILYLAAVCFIGLGGLVFLPWETLNAGMTWLVGAAYPDTPLVVYTVKISMVMLAWGGVLMAIAIADPRAHRTMLLVFGIAFLATAVACVALVRIYALPFVYYGDAVFALPVGILMLAYRRAAMESKL